MGKKPHKKLEVWKQAIALTVLIYKITATFPEIEKFGLVSQMRRAVISIASNITSPREIIYALRIRLKEHEGSRFICRVYFRFTETA